MYSTNDSGHYTLPPEVPTILVEKEIVMSSDPKTPRSFTLTDDEIEEVLRPVWKLYNRPFDLSRIKHDMLELAEKCKLDPDDVVGYLVKLFGA